MRKFYSIVLLPLIVFATLSNVAFAADEQEVINAFEHLTKEHVESYKYDTRELVYYVDPPGVLKEPTFKPYWIKSKSAVVDDYSIDIQRTNSLISPYTGVLIYKSQTWTTDKCQTKEQAQQATTFTASGVPIIYKITFSYQGNKWSATRYEYSSNGSRWYDAESTPKERMLVKLSEN